MKIRRILSAACAAVMAAGVMGTSVTANAEDSVKTMYRGHTYQLFDRGMTWEEADEYCRSLGGHLLTISSGDEQFIIEHLMENNGKRNSYWLGGKVSDGRISWVTKEDEVYTKWQPGQPDNYNGEDSLMIYKNSNPDDLRGNTEYKWNDLKSDGTCGSSTFFGLDNFGFICEWDVGDINDDGFVDVDDLMLLQKLVAGWNVPGNKIAADVNCDGTIDIDDIMLLQKKVAGWKVTLGKQV